MRRSALLLALALCVLATGSGPKTNYVKGYTRKDGTYVQGYYRSSPGSSALPSAPAATPAPLLPSPARVEPRLAPPIAAPALARVEPRLTARPVAPVVTAPVAPPAPPLPAEGADEERERRAGYKLRTAKGLLEQGTAKGQEKAIDTLQDLFEQYPNTRAAEEGRQLLATIRRR